MADKQSDKKAPDQPADERTHLQKLEDEMAVLKAEITTLRREARVEDMRTPLERMLADLGVTKKVFQKAKRFRVVEEVAEFNPDGPNGKKFEMGGTPLRLGQKKVYHDEEYDRQQIIDWLKVDSDQEELQVARAEARLERLTFAKGRLIPVG